MLGQCDRPESFLAVLGLRHRLAADFRLPLLVIPPRTLASPPPGAVARTARKNRNVSSFAARHAGNASVVRSQANHRLHLHAGTSILEACRHTGEKLPLASMANFCLRTCLLNPGRSWMFWWYRRRSPRRRPRRQRSAVLFSNIANPWSLSPARIGKRCGDSAGHPCLGLVDLAAGQTAAQAPPTSGAGR